MKTLIIRTDKLGDFYISLPYINAIIKKFEKNNVDIVLSENIYKHFKDKDYICNNFFSFPKKNLFKKITLIRKLKKNNYQNVLVLDGKDRSLIMSLFLKSNNKIIIFEKRKLNSLIKKIFFNINKYKFIYDDRIEAYQNIYKRLLDCLNLRLNDINYKFIKYENLSSLNLSSPISEDFSDYSLIHIDEKWFSEYYIKDYTDINPSTNDFFEFIKKIINKTKKNIIITTGLIELPFINKLKEAYFEKIDNNLYVFNFQNNKVFIILNLSIKNLEIISMNAKNLITCNNPLSQIAGSFEINLIDIIEEKLESWYFRHVSHIEKYNKLFRKDFKILSNEILNKIN